MRCLHFGTASSLSMFSINQPFFSTKKLIPKFFWDWDLAIVCQCPLSMVFAKVLVSLLHRDWKEFQPHRLQICTIKSFIRIYDNLLTLWNLTSNLAIKNLYILSLSLFFFHICSKMKVWNVYKHLPYPCFYKVNVFTKVSFYVWVILFNIDF